MSRTYKATVKGIFDWPLVAEKSGHNRVTHMLKPDIQFSAAALIILLTISGCADISSEIVGSDSDHVWIRKPTIGDGGSDIMADEHCARYNKTAVFETEMTISKGKRINVYACQ